MTLRVTDEPVARGTLLRVDGRLIANNVAELTRAAIENARPLTLELSGLLFADSAGLIVLRGLRNAGVVLRNVPPLLAMMLDDRSLEPES